MADLRFKDKNNQKKTGSVFASGVLEAGVDGILFNLPKASQVLTINAILVDGTGAGTGVVVGIATDTYYPTGAEVTISGVTAEEKVIVTYIETELTSGEYTD